VLLNGDDDRIARLKNYTNTGLIHNRDEYTRDKNPIGKHTSLNGVIINDLEDRISY